MAARCFSNLPVVLRRLHLSSKVLTYSRIHTSQVATDDSSSKVGPDIISPHHNMAAYSRLSTSSADKPRGREVMENFLAMNSMSDKLVFIQEVFARAKETRTKLWMEDDFSDFYRVLSSDLKSCSNDDILSVMKQLHRSDPLVHSLGKIMCDRISELDLEDTLYLGRAFINATSVTDFSPVYVRLKELVLEHMYAEDVDLSIKEIESIVRVLKDASQLSLTMVVQLALYLSQNLHHFDLESAATVVLRMAKTKRLNKVRDALFFDAVKAYVLNSLLCEFPKLNTTGVDKQTSLKGYGFYLSHFLLFYEITKVCDLEVCERLKDAFLGPHHPEIHNVVFMTSLASMCGKVLYYDPKLMDRLMQLSIENIEAFHYSELSESLEAFVRLNHPHQPLLDKVITAVALRSSDDVRMCPLFWSIINSCLYMNSYHPEMLERFLTNEMMEVSLDQQQFYSPIFLKLLIALTVENPQLKQGRISNVSFGHYPYHFRTISDRYIFHALAHILDMYQTKGFSVFGANFCRALKTATGRGHFKSEPLTLCGYSVDFEVLLGSNNKPIEIPHTWNYRPADDLFKSIGAHRSSCTLHHEPSGDNNSMPLSFLQSLRDSEEEKEEVEQEGLMAALATEFEGKAIHANLASDWGRYFVTGDGTLRAKRRVVFELNGPMHYAVNDKGHITGRDVVKKRQLEALGWEVINVPYYEWSELKNGDEHTQYIRHKLKGK